MSAFKGTPGIDFWTTTVGTIRKGAPVIAADGSTLGTVALVERDEIRLEGGGEIPLSLVDGAGEEGVLLEGRHDATFGLGGEG